MKKLWLSVFAFFLTASMLMPNSASAFQNGQHNGNKLDVSIEYQNFSGYADYSYLGLGPLPIYYIGGTMDYTVQITNLKKSAYHHLVVLVTHREYPSGNLVPGYQIDPFSGLAYHNMINIDSLGAGESLSLNYSIPWNANAGADKTDVIIYRGYDLESQETGDNEWSTGRIFFENTLGYFCPPKIN